jgi:hypothetical protein
MKGYNGIIAGGTCEPVTVFNNLDHEMYKVVLEAECSPNILYNARDFKR